MPLLMTKILQIGWADRIWTLGGQYYHNATPTTSDTLNRQADKICTHKHTSAVVILRDQTGVSTVLGMVKHLQVEFWTNNKTWMELTKWHKLGSEDMTLNGMNPDSKAISLSSDNALQSTIMTQSKTHNSIEIVMNNVGSCFQAKVNNKFHLIKAVIDTGYFAASVFLGGKTVTRLRSCMSFLSLSTQTYG